VGQVQSFCFFVAKKRVYFCDIIERILSFKFWILG